MVFLQLIKSNLLCVFLIMHVIPEVNFVVYCVLLDIVTVSGDGYAVEPGILGGG